MLVPYYLVLCLCSLGIPAFAQNSPRALDTYFTILAQHHRLNGTVLVAQAGKVVYEQAFGYADFAAHRPSTLSQTFPVASITKTVTATAVLQLQEQGQLRGGGGRPSKKLACQPGGARPVAKFDGEMVQVAGH